MTVTGPGGSGKTRLAIAMAGRAQQLIGPAVAFVSLGDVADAGRIMEAVADALGLARLPGVAPLEQVAAHLQGRPWLLILDNFEQLVETGAMQVRALLERAETVSCLVTSRVRLDLAAEQELALLPLPTPRSGVQAFRPSGVPDGRGQPGFDLAGPEHLNADHLNALMQFPSVQLFVDRARAARPGFRLTEGNGAAVAELCDRLEGLPLALELAAARAGVLSPEQMLERWEERFQLLVSRQRDVAARHRSLWAAIDSSYQMLTPDLQRFFARLAVFRGGCTLEAAAAVCGVESRVPSGPLDSGSPPMPQAAEGRLPLADPGKTQTSVGHRKPNVQNALENMEQLRACSLVIAEAEGKRAARFRLLEPLREFAWEQLAAAGELAAIRTRHRDWFLQLAEAVGSREFRTQSAGWITQAETEIDNLRAALAWCREQAEADPDGEGAACAVRLILEIPWRLSRHHGDFAEGAQWLADALAKARALPSSLHGRALLMMARYEGWRSGGKLPEALLRAACEQYERALAQARAEKNPIETLQALQSLADIVLKLGDAEAAWAFCLEARQQAEACGDLRELVISLDRMAGVLLARGEFGAARPLLEERLALCRQLQDARLLIHALGAMGHVERHEGDYRRAGALYQESLQLRRGLGYLHAQAQSLEDLASVAALREQADRAARLLGAAEALCHALGARPPAAERVSYERVVNQSRAQLGEAAYAAAWAEGGAMSLDAALDYALAEE